MCRQQLRQSKIEYLDLAPLGNKNIRWLDIAMNDAFAVGGVNGIGDLHSEPDHLITWHRTAGHAVLQGLTLQHLHDDEGTALIIIRVVDSADMGVVQR